MHKSLSLTILWPLCIALILLACNAYIASTKVAENDAALEKRVLQITEELRCLVCQNQTIAD